ncbi:MAG: LuxR C-terminal-related transcriptional regulator [Dehalococcoidia bacterium]
MEVPPIRYVKTSDGVSIAYTVAGSGPPLVYGQGTTTSHTELFWRSPGLRAPLERPSAYFTVYQFDWRNTGSSTRGVPFGREEWILDMEAMFGLFDDPADVIAGGPPVAPFVATHQDRIRRWVTWNQHRWPESHPHVQASQQVIRLFELDPVWIGLEGRRIAGEVEESTHREFAELMRSCCDRGYAKQVQAMIGSWDVGPYLAQVAVPTLVVHRRDLGGPGRGAEIGADYAAHIPGAQLHLVEGSSWLMPGEDDPLPAILTFLLGDDERLPAASEVAAARSHGLSARELEVLGLLAAGKSNRQIAEELTLSEATVATHVRHIFEKTGSANRVEAANWAREHGVV